MIYALFSINWFQHTAARRRLETFFELFRLNGCFNTQPPEGGWNSIFINVNITKSFNTQPPEGGWNSIFINVNITKSFNTQPPEGGWFVITLHTIDHQCFNTQPPEGGWPSKLRQGVAALGVSTHSRPKAAGLFNTLSLALYAMFQHTAARRRLARHRDTNGLYRRFNTQPPEGGWSKYSPSDLAATMFQHTAARRRLVTNHFDV